MRITGRREARAARDDAGAVRARLEAEIERQQDVISQQHEAILVLTERLGALAQSRAAEMVELLGEIGRTIGERITPEAIRRGCCC